jgi:hypothetical protein
VRGLFGPWTLNVGRRTLTFEASDAADGAGC